MTPTPSSLLQELVSGGSSPWGSRTEWLRQVDDVSPLARGVGGHPCARALPHVEYMPWTSAHPNGSRGVRLCCTKEGVGGEKEIGQRSEEPKTGRRICVRASLLCSLADDVLEGGMVQR